MHTTLARSLTLALALVFIAAAFVSGMPVQAMQCVNLSSDLSSGMHDAPSGGPVLMLQQYLAGAGYLSATPNGYFGPATLAAVKSFQLAHSLPSTGYVGPLSRTALSQATCGTISSAYPVSGNQSSAPATQSSAPSLSNADFSAPTNGQVLTNGQSFGIQWNSQPYPRYDLTLVTTTGGGAGFIAQSLGNVSRYAWSVGSVYSSQTQSNITVPPGTYQIRMQSSVNGSQTTDPVSAPFTIQAATLSITSVFPASIPADGRTVAVIYGSDFDTTATVNLASGGRGQVLYVSPDGRVLVFSVPVGALTGAQTVSVTNQSGQLSNQLSFAVTTS